MSAIRPSIAARIYVAAVLAFLLLPLILVCLISFSADSYLNFPPSAWGLRWHEELWNDEMMLEAALESLTIASVVAPLSIALALPASYAICRYRFPGRELVQTLLLLPLLLPGIVLGLAVLLVFSQLGLIATYPGIVLAHLAVTLPFCIRILATALSTMPAQLDDASASLGARPWQTFRHVTVPMLRPALLAASALSMILSFDEVVLSLFVVGPRLSTLPVVIFRYVTDRTDPMIAAIALTLIALSFVVVWVLQRTIGFLRAFQR